MDRIASVITQPFKAHNYKLVLFVLLLFVLLLNSHETLAQRKAKDVDVSEINEDNKEKINTYFFEGLRQKNLENYDAAIRNFENLLKLDVSNDAAYYELGNLYFKKKDFAKSMECFAKAVELKPDNSWYLENYAKACENNANFKLAEEIYSKLIKNNPDKVENYFDLAAVKLYQNDYKGAIKVYDKIESIIGINEDLISQKQKIWLRLGKVDKAAEEAKRLIKNDPNEVKYRINLAEIYLANKLLDQAKIVLEDILLIAPHNAFAQLAIADYYREKKDEDNSYKYLKLAFANKDLDIDQKIRILASYFQMIADVKYKNQAFELSRILVDTHPQEAKAYAIYGDFLYQDKQQEAAKEAYTKTIALDKKVFAVWQNLMFIQADLNDYKALVETSNEAVQLFPAQQIVHYLNALAKAQTKDYEGAITSYKNALSLGIENRELEAQIYAGIGDAYHSLKNNTESDAAYEQALKLKPDDPYVLNNYAYYLSVRNERLEKALEMSGKSNELLKNNSSFLDTYAWIMFQLKRYDEALNWIDKAIESGGQSSSTILEHRGDILFKIGRVEEAVKSWMQASEKGEPSTLLLKKIKEKKYYE